MKLRSFTSKRHQRSKKTPKVVSQSSAMLRRQILVGVALLVVVSLVLFAVYKISRVPAWQVTEVEVVGGETISHEEIEAVVREAFAGTHLRLVPQSYRLTFSEKDIETAVLALDHVKNVKADIKKGVLVVAFEEYIPYGLWCGTDESQVCMFIDQTGFAFAEAPPLQGGIYTIFIDMSLAPVKTTALWDDEYFTQVETFIDRIKSELNLYVVKVTKLGDYDTEYTLSHGGTIKTSQTMEVDESIDNLVSILQSEEFSHFTRDPFHYIDLRFGDKVFVSEEEVMATSTESAVAEEDQVILAE